MERKLVVIDTETGGLDPTRHAICSLALIVLNQGSIDGTFYTLVRDPNGGLDPEAMSVNKLDGQLEAAPSPAQVVDALESFLLEHDLREPRKVVLAGQNTPFDIGFLQRLYRQAFGDEEGMRRYGSKFTRRYLDLMPLGLALDQANRITLSDGHGSLESICKALGVTLSRKEGIHSSLDDATATAKAISTAIGLIAHRDWPAHPLV